MNEVNLSPKWKTVDGKLTRRVRFNDFQALIAAVNEVEAVAESMNHHPDLAISWRPPTEVERGGRTGKLPAVLTLGVTCFTHTTGTVESADIDLAARLEVIFA